MAPSNPEGFCPACSRSFPPELERCPDDGSRLVRLEDKDPLIGTVVDDRFEIIDRLGEGGMGTVYRANQISVGREVALKVMAERAGRRRDTARRFLREARLASQIVHPNTVTVFDFGQTAAGLLYIVMELVPGETLSDAMGREGPFEPIRAALIGVQICDALEAAHRLEIVHRDLKPGNVILADELPGRDYIKVLDFGLAKSLMAGAESNITASGLMCGTPGYIAPEAACGLEVDARADLYALGVILYELAGGRPPFDAQSAGALLVQHAAQPPAHIPGLDPGLWAVIERLLAKQKEHRYASAADCSAALRAFVEFATPARGSPLPAIGTPHIGQPVSLAAAGIDETLEGDPSPASVELAPTEAAVPSPVPGAGGDERPTLAPPGFELPTETDTPPADRGGPDELEPPRARWPWIVASLVLLVAAGTLAAWRFGVLGGPSHPSRTPTSERVAPVSPAAVDTEPEPEVRPAAPLPSTEPAPKPGPPPAEPARVQTQPVRAAASPTRRPARAAAPHPEAVRFEITSRPAARVQIDGQDLGETPVGHWVPYARSKVEVLLTRPGYRRIRKTLRADRSHRLELRLRKRARGPDYIVP